MTLNNPIAWCGNRSPIYFQLIPSESNKGSMPLSWDKALLLQPELDNGPFVAVAVELLYNKSSSDGFERIMCFGTTSCCITTLS